MVKMLQHPRMSGKNCLVLQELKATAMKNKRGLFFWLCIDEHTKKNAKNLIKNFGFWKQKNDKVFKWNDCVLRVMTMKEHKEWHEKKHPPKPQQKVKVIFHDHIDLMPWKNILPLPH